MAYTVIKNANKENYGVNYYIVDKYEELSDIPGAAAGSKAYVVDDKKNYIKTQSGEWTEYISAIGTGGGSGESPNLGNYYTKGEADEKFIQPDYLKEKLIHVGQDEPSSDQYALWLDTNN